MQIQTEKPKQKTTKACQFVFEIVNINHSTGNRYFLCDDLNLMFFNCHIFTKTCPYVPPVMTIDEQINCILVPACLQRYIDFMKKSYRAYSKLV